MKSFMASKFFRKIDAQAVPTFVDGRAGADDASKDE